MFYTDQETRFAHRLVSKVMKYKPISHSRSTQSFSWLCRSVWKVSTHNLVMGVDTQYRYYQRIYGRAAVCNLTFRTGDLNLCAPFITVCQHLFGLFTLVYFHLLWLDLEYINNKAYVTPRLCSHRVVAVNSQATTNRFHHKRRRLAAPSFICFQSGWEWCMTTGSADTDQWRIQTQDLTVAWHEGGPWLHASQWKRESVRLLAKDNSVRSIWASGNLHSLKPQLNYPSSRASSVGQTHRGNGVLAIPYTQWWIKPMWTLLSSGSLFRLGYHQGSKRCDLWASKNKFAMKTLYQFLLP